MKNQKNWKEIDELIELIEQEKEKVKSGLKVNKDSFYSRFQSDLDQLNVSYGEATKKYNEVLDDFANQLKKRKNDIINPLVFKRKDNFSNLLNELWDKYESIRAASNEFTNSLNKEQKKAQELLRLREVSDFLDTIRYLYRRAEIVELEAKANSSEVEKDGIVQIIREKEALIESKREK